MYTLIYNFLLLEGQYIHFSIKTVIGFANMKKNTHFNNDQ